MLFVFDKEDQSIYVDGRYNYTLDVIFIDEDYNVVKVCKEFNLELITSDNTK